MVTTATGERGAGRHGIVGTWQATVNRGPALTPVKSLHVFTEDGTMIESGNDTLYRSPSYGVWKYVGNRTYATTMVSRPVQSRQAPIWERTRSAPTGSCRGTATHTPGLPASASCVTRMAT